MPNVSISPEARKWLRGHCTHEERLDVIDLVHDLQPKGLDTNDADLIKLKQGADVGSSLINLRVDCFILPLRVSAAFRLGRLVWLGILRTASGPARFVGRLDIVCAWGSDPSLGLVKAEADMLDIARVMYP